MPVSCSVPTPAASSPLDVSGPFSSSLGKGHPDVVLSYLGSQVRTGWGQVSSSTSILFRVLDAKSSSCCHFRAI